jgi:nitrite reductase (NADH) small subunit
LGPLGQIPVGEGREFTVGGERVAVFRGRDGRLYACEGVCPHQGGRISDGILGGGQVVCPLHSYKFDLADGRQVGAACEPLRTFPVWLDDGDSLMLQLED